MVGVLMDHGELKAGLARLYLGEATDDDIENLEDLVEMFKPYKGDTQDDWKERNPIPSHCGNCGFETTLMFAPASLTRASQVALRLCQCPRCYSTDMRLGVESPALG